MLIRRRAQVILTVVSLILAGAAAYMSLLISERQRALTRISRYDLTWSAGQAGSEVARFGHSVGVYALAPTGQNRREVQDRFEILESRAGILRSGDFRAFTTADPQGKIYVDAFKAAIGTLAPLLQQIDNPGNPAKILAIVSPMNAGLARLASLANNFVALSLDADRVSLARLHWAFSGLNAALILCGLALVWLLKVQFRVITKAHGDLSVQNERFDTSLNNMSQGLCMFDEEHRLIVANRRLAEVLAVDPALLTRGSQVDRIIAVGGSENDTLALLAKRTDVPEADDLIAFTRETVSGRIIAVAQQPMAGGGWVATYEDITQRKRHEERVAYLASHDTLTGLPNRSKFQTDLERALAADREMGCKTALHCLDLDRFKAVNDTLGHHSGDLLLKEVASRIALCLRKGDTVARLGGDEFSIIQRGVQSRGEIAALAGNVVEVLRQPYDLDGHRVVVEASLGIAVSPDDADNADWLLKQADVALYRCKNEGRGAYRFFELGMDSHIHERRALEIDLHTAMERNEFELHFQPIVDLAPPHAVRCYEALLRWNHPVRGMVPPAEFIPVSEEIGLIVPLGAWILEEACRQAATWTTSAKLAVNLSPVQFKRDDIVATVCAALELSGFPADRLELEITESVLMDDHDRTQAVLQTLRELGVWIAMDDFGTGYSSLSYLRKFAFNKIKIDRAFVSEIHVPQSRDIIQAIATLGRSLGMTVTAEGVETQEQAVLLLTMGCHEGQGYYFSRPRPSTDFPELSKAPGTASMLRVA
jgi:diguanylate cyclase (GGDEF)-like protein